VFELDPLSPGTEEGDAILVLAAEGDHMAPTVMEGDFVLVDPGAFDGPRPQRGDIVAFTLPSESSSQYLRRVVGLPGEVIELKAGKVIVDGYVLEEPYIESFSTDRVESPCEPLTVDEASVYVLSDHREAGDDSRSFGTVPLAAVLGKVFLPADDFLA
jgi:signal peptidase I